VELYRIFKEKITPHPNALLFSFSFSCTDFNWNIRVYRGTNLADKVFFNSFQVEHIAEVWVTGFWRVFLLQSSE